ncbi:MAG: metallophosphoesterase [bacterium]
MPRQARLDVPGALHHIMTRGKSCEKNIIPSFQKILILFFYFFSILFLDCTNLKEIRYECTPKFSFAVLADPRDGRDTWRNAILEIRDMKINPKPFFNRAEFLIVAGDMDPLEERYNDYNELFAESSAKPKFLPVIGNHEFENGGKHFRYARDIIIPLIPNVVRRHSKSCDYYFDYMNARIIAVDGYSELGKNGVINNIGMEWVEQIIMSTPENIKHVFISFHEPAFPRYSHLNDAFNESLRERDAFWEMLVRHRGKVRAVFVGHTHNYYRMRVFYPSGVKANSFTDFPDEEEGIYQIDAGASGKGDINTIVQVQIDYILEPCRQKMALINRLK